MYCATATGKRQHFLILRDKDDTRHEYHRFPPPRLKRILKILQTIAKPTIQ